MKKNQKQAIKSPFLPNFSFSNKKQSVYGPLWSRRFSWSLGINLGVPENSFCNWNCIYCHCGASKPRRKGNIFIPKKKVLQDFCEILKEGVLFDNICFAGNTEPTLHPEFGEIFSEIFRLKNQYLEKVSLTVLSNGTTLDRGENLSIIRQNINYFWFKLDSPFETGALKLNRPMSKYNNLSYREILGMLSFLDNPNIQTMLIESPVFGNFDEITQREFIKIFKFLNPGIVHLVTLKNKTPENSLFPVHYKDAQRFKLRLEENGINAISFV